MSDRFVSVDDHVQESPSVWTERLSKRRWGDRIPHLDPQADGTDHWVVDGLPIPLGAAAGVGATMADGSEPRRWEDVPAAAFMPTERLAAMNEDGVDYSVLYPSVAGMAGETFGRLSDPAFELACVQAYNDWLIDEWATYSDRFIPQCIVPIYPAQAAASEIERAVARGHRGVVYPAVPMELRDVPHINGPEYDPIWATCQELGVPICFHAGASTATQLPPYPGYAPALAAALGEMTKPVSNVFVLANLLFSRILVRYPHLSVVFPESTLAWAAFVLEYADHQFERTGLFREGYELRPSEMFRRQCYIAGWYDRAGITTRRFVGTDNMLWSTNFPLATSTWPASRKRIAECFDGVDEDERHRILWENAARLYRL